MVHILHYMLWHISNYFKHQKINRYNLFAYKCEDVKVGSRTPKESNPKTYIVDIIPRFNGGRL